MRTRKHNKTESNGSGDTAPTSHIVPTLPLRVARKVAQLSQHELAAAVGVDRSYIAKLESGSSDIQHAGLEVASRIAWALHVTVAELWPLVHFVDGKPIDPAVVREPVGGRS